MKREFSDTLPLHLKRTVEGEESINDFLHWFNPVWWDAESSADDDDLTSFVNRIDSLIYVLISGGWDDAEFLRHLDEEASAFYGAVPLAVRA